MAEIEAMDRDKWRARLERMEKTEYLTICWMRQPNLSAEELERMWCIFVRRRNKRVAARTWH